MLLAKKCGNAFCFGCQGKMVPRRVASGEHGECRMPVEVSAGARLGEARSDGLHGVRSCTRDTFDLENDFVS